MEGKRAFPGNVVVCWAHPQREGGSPSLWCHISGEPVLEVVPVSRALEWRSPQGFATITVEETFLHQSVFPACPLFLQEHRILGEGQLHCAAAGGIKSLGFDGHTHLCIPYNPVLETTGIP